MTSIPLNPWRSLKSGIARGSWWSGRSDYLITINHDVSNISDCTVSFIVLPLHQRSLRRFRRPATKLCLFFFSGAELWKRGLSSKKTCSKSFRRLFTYLPSPQLFVLLQGHGTEENRLIFHHLYLVGFYIPIRPCPLYRPFDQDSPV